MKRRKEEKKMKQQTKTKKEYSNTNPIIDYAKAVLNSGEDIDQLLADAKVLKEHVAEGYELEFE